MQRCVFLFVFLYTHFREYYNAFAFLRDSKGQVSNYETVQGRNAVT